MRNKREVIDIFVLYQFTVFIDFYTKVLSPLLVLGVPNRFANFCFVTKGACFTGGFRPVQRFIIATVKGGVVIDGDGLFGFERHSGQWNVDFQAAFNVLAHEFVTSITELNDQVTIIVDTDIKVF